MNSQISVIGAKLLRTAYAWPLGVMQRQSDEKEVAT
jgi:hypothetical protein